MSDKPIAGLLTAIAVAPLCLVCALGPAASVAAAGSFLAWLGGFTLLPIVAAVAVVGWVGWRVLQQWQRRRSQGIAGVEVQR